MATRGIEGEVVDRILDMIRPLPELVDATVEPGYPGDAAGPVAVWVSDIDSEIRIPTMKAGRKHRNDDFVVPVEVRAQGFADLTDTAAKLDEVLGAIESRFADDPGLGALDGVIAAEVQGRRRSVGVLKSGGAVGFGQIPVGVKTRLT